MGTFPNPDTQFKPGVCPPGAGRPKGSKNRSTIARQFAEVITGGIDVSGNIKADMTAEELMIAALWRKAFDGDINAIKEIQDTLYGKLTDKQELSGPDGGPLTAIMRKVIDPKSNDNPTN